MYRRAWRQWAYAAFVIGGAIIGQHWGLAGVAWAVLLALAVNVLLQAHLVMKLVPFTWSDLLAAHGPALLTASFVGLPAFTTALLLREVLHLPPLGVLSGTLAAAIALPHRRALAIRVRHRPDQLQSRRRRRRSCGAFRRPSVAGAPRLVAPLHGATAGVRGGRHRLQLGERLLSGDLFLGPQRSGRDREAVFRGAVDVRHVLVALR